MPNWTKIVISDTDLRSRQFLAQAGLEIVDTLGTYEIGKFEFAELEFVVLLAELKWSHRYLSGLHGFEILRRLRAEQRVRCPIVVCSFLPLRYFNSNPKYELLKAPGHTFIQLPFRPEKGETIDDYIKRHLGAPLTEELLDDIVDHLCDPKGLVHEIHHRLKNAVVVPPGEEQGDISRQRIVKAVDDAFQSLSCMFPNDVRVAETRQRLLKDLEENVFARNQYTGAIERVSQFAGDFERLTPATADVTPAAVEAPPWKILYVDDEAHLRERLQAEFERRNLVCFTCATAEEAFSALKDDAKTNSITVVITDYRLEQADTFRKWQEMQGYAIIKEVYLKHDNLLSFFALTAASRRALMRIQKAYQVKVNVYSKEDVLSSDGAFNMFAEAVRRQGYQVYDAVCSQPQLTSWHQASSSNKFPLKDYYRTHRQSLDRERSEAWIGKIAQDYVDNIAFAEESYDKGVAAHSYDLQAKLSEPPDDHRTLERFRQRLLGRRIALGLHVRLGFTRERIYFAMRKSPVVDIETLPQDERPGKKSIDALLSTSLALSLEDDIPDHLLVEERSWLKEAIDMESGGSDRIAYTRLGEFLDYFREKLRKAQCTDEFVRGNRRISDSEGAKRELETASALADHHEMSGTLKTLMVECWQDASPVEKQAFRGTGTYSLIKRYLGRQGTQGVNESEYSLGAED